MPHWSPNEAFVDGIPRQPIRTIPMNIRHLFHRSNYLPTKKFGKYWKINSSATIYIRQLKTSTKGTMNTHQHQGKASAFMNCNVCHQNNCIISNNSFECPNRDFYWCETISGYVPTYRVTARHNSRTVILRSTTVYQYQIKHRIKQVTIGRKIRVRTAISKSLSHAKIKHNRIHEALTIVCSSPSRNYKKLWKCTLINALAEFQCIMVYAVVIHQ